MTGFQKFFFFLIVLTVPVVTWGDHEEDWRPLDGSCCESLSPEERQLLNEFVKAYPRLKEAYGNCVLEADAEILQAKLNSQRIFEKPLTLIRQRQGVFKALDQQYFLLDGTTTPADGNSSRRVALIRPEESFLFELGAVTEQFFLAEQGTDQEKYHQQLVAKDKFFQAPFAYWGQRLDYMLFESADPEAKIVSVSAVEEEGERLLVIQRTFRGRHGKQSQLTDTITLFRDRLCAVKKIERGYPDSEDPSQLESKRVQTCYYSGEQQGVPALSKVVYELLTVDKGDVPAGFKPGYQEVFRIRTNLSPPPQDVFDVRHYFNPIQRLAKSGESINLKIGLLIVNGLVLIAFGIYLVRRWRQQPSTSVTDRETN